MTTFDPFVEVERRLINNVVAYLSAQAMARFDQYGPYDARGAALWDAARALDPADGNALEVPCGLG